MRNKSEINCQKKLCVRTYELHHSRQGLSDLSIQDVPQPSPSEGEVLIKTKAVGIKGVVPFE